MALQQEAKRKPRFRTSTGRPPLLRLPIEAKPQVCLRWLAQSEDVALDAHSPTPAPTPALSLAPRYLLCVRTGNRLTRLEPSSPAPESAGTGGPPESGPGEGQRPRESRGDFPFPEKLDTYWGQFFQVAAVTAGAWTATYSILASAIRVPGGFLADRLGGERTAILALSVTLAGALLLSWTHQYGVAVLGLLLIGVGMGVTNAAVFKLVPQEVPQAVGGAAGWVGGLGAFGGFAIPPMLGWAVERWGPEGYARGFLVFVGLVLLSLALVGLLAIRRARIGSVRTEAV